MDGNRVKSITKQKTIMNENSQKPKEELEKNKREAVLDSTARFMFNVFNIKSGKYSIDFEKLLMAGGGGNSMFVNCWTKPSEYFTKTRISSKAKEILRKNGYNSIDEAPHEFKFNNAKKAVNRIKKGKYLHLDHNPGNVKVLMLIREKCREFNPDNKAFNFEKTIKEIKSFLLHVQTLDWITVEQDDVRTYGDKHHSKIEKAKMNKDQRDQLLNDYWEYL